MSLEESQREQIAKVFEDAAKEARSGRFDDKKVVVVDTKGRYPDFDSRGDVKFVQAWCTYDALFALDSDGVVWSRDEHKGYWFQIPTKRLAT